MRAVLAHGPRPPVLPWRRRAHRPAAGARRRHPGPDRRWRLRPGRGRAQRAPRAGKRGCVAWRTARVGGVARPRLRRVPAGAGGARGLGVDGTGAACRQAHRQQPPGLAAPLACRQRDRRRSGGAVGFGGDRAAARSGRRGLRPGLQWRHPGRQPAQAGVRDPRQRGSTGGSGDAAGRTARRAGRDAAAPDRRRAAHQRQQVAAVPGLARGLVAPVAAVARRRAAHHLCHRRWGHRGIAVAVPRVD